MFFSFLIFGLPVLNLLFWWWADRRARTLPRSRLRKILRGGLAAFALFQAGYYLSIIASRRMGLNLPLHPPLIGLAYLWHLVVLPLAIIGVSALALLGGTWRGAAWLRRAITRETSPPLPTGEGQTALSRRDFLAASLAAAPPLVALTGTAVGLSQLDHFRVRRLTLTLPALPPNLDGLTIAHVTDTHIGKYTNGRVLQAITEQTNLLKPDLVCFTGDLIDFSLADLPAGIDLLRRFDPRHGLVICEGNHDLFQGRIAFEEGLKNAGLPLLVNEEMTIKVRGEVIRFLGLRWGMLPGSRSELFIDEWMHRRMERRLPGTGAFEIMLAHHPHAFDAAADAGIPLTLAGHTHGGQLMLTQELGPGPMMFRYWSGLYRRADAALVVSNGAGNWFPLRVNAPAEIVHLTLRRA